MSCIQRLEPRRLLAFSAFIPDTTRLKADLTAGNDTFVVAFDESAGLLRLTLNGVTESHPRASVSQLLINAGAGDDTILMQTRLRTEIFADAGNDFVRGAAGRETIHGGTGGDTLDGGGGNDVLIEAESSSSIDNENDMLFGRGGDDTFILGGGDDVVDGGTGGRDSASYHFHNSRLTLSLDRTPNDGTLGSAGGNLLNLELVTGGEGRDRIVGSSRAETLSGGGSDGADTIFGNGGDDHITTVAPGSVMDGGSGDDQITGRNATVHGQGGDDDITLQTGDGTGPPDEPNGGFADGGSGNDTLRGIGPAFTLRGSGGDDNLVYSAQSQGINGAIESLMPLTADIGGGGGRDSLELVLLIVSGGNEDGYGITFDDIANDGVQAMQGQMNFRSDFEVVRGSPGHDSLDAGGLQRGIHINGGFNNDTIIGGNGSNLLEGEDGNDRLTGGEADDVLRGGPGMDELSDAGGRDSFNGGKGNDTFYAVDSTPDTINGAQGLDDIAEFDDGLDTLIRVEREI